MARGCLSQYEEVIRLPALLPLPPIPTIQFSHSDSRTDGSQAKREHAAHALGSLIALRLLSVYAVENDTQVWNHE